MKIEFTNVHFDGEIRTKWDAVLRIVGDFILRMSGRVVYREVEFCLVEFAVALASWFAVATDMGPDFVYTSMESETEGLVRFTRLKPGTWRVSAADQDHDEAGSLTTTELKNEALEYIRNLRVHLLPKFDILQYVEDVKVRNILLAKLE